MVPRVRGYSVQDSHRGGRMRKLGAVAATGAVLALALAAWTRQPSLPAQGGAKVTGKIKFVGTKPAMPKIDMTEEPKCNVHGWMHAWLGVLPHPFFSVSGADGSFTLAGLPPGTYTIEAWHEKYGTQTASVTVAGSEAKTADFSFAAK